MNKRKLILSAPMLVLLFAISLTNRTSFSFFNDDSVTQSNVFAVASIFPSPSVSLSPSPSATASATPSLSPTPSPSAGPVNHVVINEVYYFVDGSHGGVNIVISGNGANSNNSVNVSNSNTCVINQSNNSNVNTNINNNTSTGGNTASGNTGGNTTVGSGDATSSAVVVVGGNSNNSSGCSSNGNGQNNEWVELYNPTNAEIALKDYTLTDNSGISIKIPGNFKIPSKKFALLSKSNATWSFWSEPAGTLKIPLGHQIGDSLDDGGDRIILKDKNGLIVDQMSWGSDNSIFSLIGVAQGHALERSPDGKDTDSAPDFTDQSPPTPGS